MTKVVGRNNKTRLCRVSPESLPCFHYPYIDLGKFTRRRCCRCAKYLIIPFNHCTAAAGTGLNLKKKTCIYIYICQSAEQAMSIIGFSGLPGAHAQIQEQSPGERSHGVKNSLIWTHNFYQALQWSSGVWPLSFATLAPDVNLRVCRKLEFSSLKKVMGTIYFTRCHPKDMERSNLQLQQHLV